MIMIIDDIADDCSLDWSHYYCQMVVLSLSVLWPNYTESIESRRQVASVYVCRVAELQRALVEDPSTQVTMAGRFLRDRSPVGLLSWWAQPLVGTG